MDVDVEMKPPTSRGGGYRARMRKDVAVHVRTLSSRERRSCRSDEAAITKRRERDARYVIVRESMRMVDGDRSGWQVWGELSAERESGEYKQTTRWR